MGEWGQRDPRGSEYSQRRQKKRAKTAVRSQRLARASWFYRSKSPQPPPPWRPPCPSWPKREQNTAP